MSGNKSGRADTTEPPLGEGNPTPPLAEEKPPEAVTVQEQILVRLDSVFQHLTNGGYTDARSVAACVADLLDALRDILAPNAQQWRAEQKAKREAAENEAAAKEAAKVKAAAEAEVAADAAAKVAAEAKAKAQAEADAKAAADARTAAARA